MSTSNPEKPKVVICRHLGPDVMPQLLSRSELNVVIWPEDRECDRSWLLENVKGASGVLVMLSDKVNQELLDVAGPGLKVVSTMSVGYEHVELRALHERGVRLGYTPDVLTDAVADLSVMLALMASRNAGSSLSVVREGRWPVNPWAPFIFCGPQISSTSAHPTRTVGFLGFGRIAQATLKRLVAFGVTDCIYTGNPSSAITNAPSEKDAALAQALGLTSLKRVDLPTVASKSDVLFILAPGGQATYHIVNADFLRKMKPTAILVNTARGTLVDSDALAQALREGWLWGAGVDVVEGEPNITADHPLVKEPRCVVLPHIASATFETRLHMATMAAENLIGGVLDESMPTELDLRGR